MALCKSSLSPNYVLDILKTHDTVPSACLLFSACAFSASALSASEISRSISGKRHTSSSVPGASKSGTLSSCG